MAGPAFGGGDEGPEDLSEEARQCIIAQLGHLPDSPGELTDDQMDLVMSACFADEAHGRRGQGGPRVLDAETQHCIIGIVGSLPENPGDLTKEQKGLIAQQCLRDDQRRGGQRGAGQARGNLGRTTPVSTGMSPAVRRCIVSLIGRVPTNSNDLTDNQKRLIGARCFNRSQVTNRGQQAGGGPSQGRPGQAGGGQQATGATGRQQPGTATPQPGQPSVGQGLAPASSGQQSAGASMGGGQLSQAATGGQRAPARPPVAQPAPAAAEPVLVLTEKQRQIQRIIIDFNETKEMEVAGVIGRFAGVQGSLTASIKTLSVVNNLLAKGTTISNAKWKEVFEKLDN